MPLAPDMDNPRADRVSAVRALAQRSVRDRQGLTVAEGPQSAREAVRFAAERVRELYISARARERWPEITEEALKRGIRVHPVSEEVSRRLSGDSQGIVAVLEQRTQALAQVLEAAPVLVAICEEVKDPGNAGTIIRAADAAGADAVIFTQGSVEVMAPKVIRSSAGSVFHLPVVSGVALQDAIEGVRRAGLAVLAADGHGTEDIETSARLSAPTAWVFGTEAAGLSDDARAASDALVTIPLRGHAESLNVAMAATLCLYASSRVLARGE